MAHEIEWSEEATADLDEIARYIAQTSPRNASDVVAAILAAARCLPILPYAHRMVPEWQDTDRRETFVHRWRLMYRIMPDRIRIVGVIHGARLLDNLQGRSFEEAPQQEYAAS